MFVPWLHSVRITRCPRLALQASVGSHELAEKANLCGSGCGRSHLLSGRRKDGRLAGKFAARGDCPVVELPTSAASVVAPDTATEQTSPLVDSVANHPN